MPPLRVDRVRQVEGERDGDEMCILPGNPGRDGDGGGPRGEGSWFSGHEGVRLSSRGPFFRFLAREVKDLTYSEYFDDVPSGTFVGDIQCQDVQQLWFENGSFDVCTSTEVFEHVPDDLRGFREVRRVLAPGGVFLFTVPLHDAERTVERARMENGVLVHLLPPEYHEDNIRGRQNVLVYRDYGRDIVERLRTAGFTGPEIVPVREPSGMGHSTDRRLCLEEMKILVITAFVPSNRTAGQNYMLQLIEDLANDHRVDVAYFHYAADTPYTPLRERSGGFRP